MTRRTFSLALGAATAPAQAARGLNVGIGTYSYHSLSMDDMIVQLKALRIKEIEMSRGEFMLMHHPPAELFQFARTKLDRAGIRCVSYYAPTIANDQDLENAVRFAKLLGSENISGDALGGMLKRIDEVLTREGLTFGIHNHYFKEGFAYESPEEILKAIGGLSKTVGCTLDTGHFASCGYDPAEAVRKLSARLKMVHLKDIAAAGGEVNVLLGSGIAKIPEVMRELRRTGYSGLVAIEYEKEGSVEDDLRREVAYARKLAAAS
jgi:inosose dehydratase